MLAYFRPEGVILGGVVAVKVIDPRGNEVDTPSPEAAVRCADPLEEVTRLIDFEAFRPVLEEHCATRTVRRAGDRRLTRFVQGPHPCGLVV
jgi:hypothetical protein